MSSVSIERDFAILEDFLAPSENHWDAYVDGQELCRERARHGACTSRCRFVMFGDKRAESNKY